MKQILLLAFAALFTAGLNAQTIYVDADANGSEDGTSWANAYSELDSAFVNAPPGAEVWVAEGTYFTPSDRSFYILSELTVRGGFAGDETAASEADPDAHETILSGDVGGNDTEGVYDSIVGSDNQRILTILSVVDDYHFTVALDGLTFTNGVIAGDANSLANAGGGLYSQERVVGNRLKFTNNRAYIGSAITLYGTNTSGSSLNDLTVTGNFTSINRALFLSGLDSFSLSNSDFSGNGVGVVDLTGILRMENSTNIEVTKCSFSDINSDIGVGAGLRFDNCLNVSVTECTFQDIVTPGGAVFLSYTGSDDIQVGELSDHTLSNLTFVNCQSTFRGGAIRLENVSASLSNIQIEGGFALSSAGALYALYDAYPDTRDNWQLIVSGSSISNTSARNPDDGSTTFGGACSLLSFAPDADSPSAEVDIIFDDVTFNDCQAGDDSIDNYRRAFGGAVYLQNSGGTNSSVSLNNVTASENTATLGGAFMINSRFTVVIESSEFIDNKGFATGSADAEAGGGALFLDLSDPASIRNTTIRGNKLSALSTTRGGAIYASFPTEAPPAGESGITLSLDNVTLEENAGQIGGAIYVQGSYELDIDNSEFLTNGLQEEDDGVLATTIGGAIGSITGSTSSIRIDSSSFIGNLCTSGEFRSGGGAIYTQASYGKETFFESHNNVYRNNSTTGTANGGALYLSGPTQLTIADDGFFNNSSNGEGGAIALIANTDTDTTQSPTAYIIQDVGGSVNRTYFASNFAQSQGGAISTQQAAVDLVNNVFTNNRVSEGSGGAVIFNGNAPDYNADQDSYTRVGELQLTADILHNTFYDNSKARETSYGAQLAFFQPGGGEFDEDNSMTVNLYNNIFIVNGGIEDEVDQVAIEPYSLGDTQVPDEIDPIGDITINAGGNFINTADGIGFEFNDDNIVSNVLDDEEDDFAGLFFDLLDDDDDVENNLILACGTDDALNVLVDGGVTPPTVNLPSVDFTGAPRPQGQGRDIGAFEVDCITSTGEQIDESGLDMAFFPNPTVDVVTIQNNEAGISQYHLILADQQGRVISSNVVTSQTSTLDMTTLPVGIYNLQLMIDGKMYSKQIVRQ